MFGPPSDAAPVPTPCADCFVDLLDVRVIGDDLGYLIHHRQFFLGLLVQHAVVNSRSNLAGQTLQDGLLPHSIGPNPVAAQRNNSYDLPFEQEKDLYTGAQSGLNGVLIDWELLLSSQIFPD